MAAAPDMGTTNDKRTLVVAGGGIAGLTAALALCREGFRIIVLERAPSRRSEGAGIQLTPNAFRVLDGLGLGKMLRGAASFPEHIALHNASSGAELNRFELGKTIRKRHGAPYAVIHRADLAALLAGQCASLEDIEIRYDEQVLDAAVHANGVTVLSQSGTTAREINATGLIVADGVWSSLADIIPDRAKPEFSGQIAWRATALNEGTIPNGIEANNTHLWMAPNSHLVTYGMRMGREINLVAVTQWADKAEPKRGQMIPLTDRAAFNQHFANWNAPVAEYLTSDKLNWTGWPLFAAEKPRALSHGPVVLIGDAAHAMLPFAAQGGAQAIEDAAVLAKCCGAKTGDLAGAFAQYGQERMERVSKVMATARKNRRIYHLPQPLSFARNFVLRHTPQERLQKRVDWIYRWKLEGESSSKECISE
ncbi:FAD-dependent monooxygenase [Ahrensia sp. R2A130]|uniref:FAD-dependent monooxygenase n=1 Tax=Ahrensia sp. R2A130 TaxID=744979 RepID=UPI0001E0F830|nr:FAD-dependent monooxygenase [Ahrensia sp. R2A130]EFL90472.1 salicylate hydroxylase [Ahrensia sp. R2A130]